eukprot:6208618-Pleurochrysis_carterae.AAC.5
MEVEQARLISAPSRCVVWCRHAGVPLANHVRAVAGRGELSGDPSHVTWDARKARHGVGGIEDVRLCIQRVYVVGVAPGL